ncbi:hypothetical protein GF345_06215 [Candidatus Woesearchaeota archaeon]|nr:hypothetical protein [Candidatus Woesearchaeota archaeon]
MAKAKQKSGVVDVWKKKRWHKIIAPKMFNEQLLGETPALEPGMAKDRTVTVNLMHLTRDMKKQNINMTFEVSRVMGDTAYTSVKKFELIPSSIKRFVRRGRQRVDDSFLCLTADNKKVRVKPLIITRNNVTGSVSTALRKKAKEYLVVRIKKNPSDKLLQDTVNHRIQKDLKDILSKTYPLRTCEIRILSFEKEESTEQESEDTSEQQDAQAEKKTEDNQAEVTEDSVKKEAPAKEVKEADKEKKPAAKKKAEEKPDQDNSEKEPKKEEGNTTKTEN